MGENLKRIIPMTKTPKADISKVRPQTMIGDVGSIEGQNEARIKK